ncbi:hypothetical protein, partial [Pseudoroseomonas ludipueritiae]
MHGAGNHPAGITTRRRVRRGPHWRAVLLGGAALWPALLLSGGASAQSLLGSGASGAGAGLGTDVMGGGATQDLGVAN